MTAQLQPIHLYGGGAGPNPWKVVILLEELGIPYKTTVVPYGDVKKPDYVKVNPNGRLPAIHDPNTDITLWESGAILEYIADKYDLENKFSFPAARVEYYHCKQWLHLQTSGQGPYYGQAAWFKLYHLEKLPSAVERYVKEVARVTAVLDKQLEGRQYLVGDKFTFVDIAFYGWQLNAGRFLGEQESFKPADYPNVQAWLDRVGARPVVEKTMAEAAKFVPGTG